MDDLQSEWAVNGNIQGSQGAAVLAFQQGCQGNEGDSDNVAEISLMNGQSVSKTHETC